MAECTPHCETRATTLPSFSEAVESPSLTIFGVRIEYARDKRASRLLIKRVVSEGNPRWDLRCDAPVVIVIKI
jgi:hypothetical protein